MSEATLMLALEATPEPDPHDPLARLNPEQRSAV
jgi:hypothetical protein